MSTPTFLICSERSGSNLIRAMLDAHSQVYAPVPMNLGRDFWYQIYRYGDLARDDNWAALLRDIAERLREYPAEIGVPISETELHDAVSERSFGRVYAYIYGKGMALAGKSELFLKENYVGQHLALFRDAFPGARFVYQVRDPRDYLLSCRRVARKDPLYRSDAACLDIWKRDQEAALNTLFTKGATQVFVQRYEDLVRDPATVLEALCSFLQIPFEDAMLRYHERRASRVAAGKQPEFWQNLSKPVISDNVGNYRNGLSGLAVRTVEYRLGHLMRPLGYELSSNGFSPPRRWALRLYELWRRVPSLRPAVRPSPKEQPAVRAASAAASDRVHYPYLEDNRDVAEPAEPARDGARDFQPVSTER
jgi:hypothetical protein